MTDSDRLMVQYLLKNRMVEKPQLYKRHREIFGKNSSVNFKDTIDKIRKNMREINADIQETICEVTGKSYFVFVPLVPYKCLEKTVCLNENEMEYYNILVKAIICSQNGSILSNDALNQCPKNMSKTDAQKTLDRFSEDNIFYINSSFIRFTPLTISEIKHFIRDNFPNEVVYCGLCSEIVFIGYICDSCQCKMHNHCLSKWLNDGHHNSCPLCDQVMDVD